MKLAVNHRLIDDIPLHEFHGPVQIFALAGGEIVVDKHIHTIVYEGVDEVRSDESGSAGHDRSGQ